MATNQNQSQDSQSPNSSVKCFPLTPKELQFPAPRCAEGISGLLKCLPKIPVELAWQSKTAASFAPSGAFTSSKAKK